MHRNNPQTPVPQKANQTRILTQTDAELQGRQERQHQLHMPEQTKPSNLAELPDRADLPNQSDLSELADLSDRADLPDQAESLNQADPPDQTEQRNLQNLTNSTELTEQPVLQTGQNRIDRTERKSRTKQRSRKSSIFSKINREILLTSSFFAVLFLAMIIYLGVLMVRDNPEQMINNDYNSRQQILASKNYRGTLYTEKGETLAETELLADGEEIRSYPYGSLFAHGVGYATKGKTGAEALANYYLINSNTALSNKASNDAAGLKNPGDNVYTTFNLKLQQTASDEMGIYKGAILVTEVATGKILALVSQPDFDPNEIDAIWDELVEDKESSVLLNRVTHGLYPPGSTYKIITALEYLQENQDNYENYHYSCNGFYKFGDSKISCYHQISHGNVNFVTSFAKSCNCSFANIGMQLERKQFGNTLTKLLFNKKLPTDLPTVKSSVMVTEQTTDAQMIQVVIGQGTDQMTPIHLHMITSTIAGKGILMKPYLLSRVENDAGRIIKSFSPKEAGRLMSEADAGILAMMMKEVVEEGTGTSLSGRAYSAAGKTGSAEFGAVKGESHAWFTGFAPAEDPKVCVTVILEGAGSGGDYAAPVARRIMDAYFQEYPDMLVP